MSRELDEPWDRVTILRRKQTLRTDYSVDELAHMMWYLDEGFASITEYRMTLRILETFFAETVGEIANLTCMAQSVLAKLGQGRRLLSLLKAAVEDLPERGYFAPHFLAKLSGVVSAAV